MRKILIPVIILLISICGCGKKVGGDPQEIRSVKEEITTKARVSEEITTASREVVTIKATEPVNVEAITYEASTEATTFDSQVATTESASASMTEATTFVASRVEVTKAEVNTTAAPTIATQTVAVQPTTTVATVTVTELAREETTSAYVPVDYDPNRVVALATAKCMAGGMIRTSDNLDALYASGKISKADYEDWYPYDGLGYYSVFVETDLKKASTLTGRLLESEEGIADYIAGMLLLEVDPDFYIEYAGATTYRGNMFYEIRCYR